MNRKRLVLKVLMALTVASSSVYASEVPSYDMQEIIVSADAVKPALSTDTINVQTVSPGKASSIPDLLQQVTGIDVQRRTSAGDNQDGTVVMRGVDSRRFTVLVDGRPINMSGVMGGSYVDWNSIPLNTVDKIQIIKGAKAAAYGNTEGGVINIITKDPSKNGGEVSILAGQNSKYQYRFNYGGKEERLGWSVYTNKTGENAFLRNNDYDGEQYGIKLKYDITDKDAIKFNYNHAEEKRGLILANYVGAPNGYDPHFPIISAIDAEAFFDGTAANPGAYLKKTLNNWDSTWVHKTNRGFTALTYWKNDESRREVNVSSTGNVTLDRTVVADKSSGWQLSGEEKINKNRFGYGADYKQLRYDYGSYSTGSGMALFPSQKINLFGAYLENTWSLDKRWTGNIGLRYDRMSGSGDADSTTRNADYNALSPKVNFSFRNNQNMTTFISANRLWRAPSMAEFYWWSKNYASSVPAVIGAGKDLKPEKGMNYEIGVEKRVSSKYSTKVSVYYQDINDYINFLHKWPFSCYNIDQAKIWGFEWENTYKLTTNSQLQLNYTNQHTKKYGVNSADNNGLPGELDYRPEHKVSLAYQLDTKPWQLRYTMNYTGRQSANYPYGSTSAVTIGGYVVHNLSAVRQMGGGRTLTVSLDNIFNKNYVEQYNYAMQGRVFSASLTQKL